MPPERHLAAILHADIVGYSRLMAEDEDDTIRRVTAYRQEIELLVDQHRGALLDFTWDNFLAEFGSAVAAVECATQIQRSVAARNAPLPDAKHMRFRIGVHLGEVTAEGQRVFGTGINVAARIQALADPGGLCVSAKVHQELRNRLDLEYEDLGEQSVKNIPDPVRVFRVLEPSAAVEPAQGLGKPARRLVAAGVVLGVAIVLAAGFYLDRTL